MHAGLPTLTGANDLALQRVPRILPILEPAGVAPHAFVPVVLQDLVSLQARYAFEVGVVDDDLVLRVEVQ